MAVSGKKSRKKCWIIITLIAVILLLLGICLIYAISHVENSYRHHVYLRCAANLKVNGSLCLMYAENNHGNFPDCPDFIKKNSGYMQCLSEPDKSRDSYLLIPGLTTKNSGGMPLMIERIRNHRNQKVVPAVLVSGNAVLLKKEFQNYTSLLSEFYGITLEEREYLHTVLAEWDKGNFSFSGKHPSF